MKGDFTRTTFRPAKRYSSVRMQQGRVQLDADWNEQVDIEERLREISLRDVIGPCGTPKDEHGGGFRIEVTDGGANLAISGGRTYVDGILCEIAPPEGETFVPLTEQIDLPAIDLPAAGSDGRYFVYVDVWQRHITALEDPEIREVALGGPDTATRTRTICQVKLCEVEGDDLDCASLPEGWIECTAAPSGQMRARTRPVDTDPDPCVVPAAAGYTRLENQLYRIEVHQGGELGGPGPQPTFKWSRDNGSIVSDWLATDGQDVSVRSLGRDRLLTLEGARWVELADDVNELLGDPGLLVEVIGTGENTLTVTPAPPAPDLSRRPKVRRWDMDTATGAIPIAQAPDDDSWIRLEGGIEVDFAPGTYRTGDYWLIPARAFIGEFAGDIEWPTDGGGQPLLQSPAGIEHHYCKLAFVEVEGGLFVDPPTDCRDPFCPLTELEPGCCTVVVQPGENVQAALDSLPVAGGCVCLKTGVHEVADTVTVAGSNVVLHGESPGTRLRGPGDRPVLAVAPAGFGRLQAVTIHTLRIESDNEGLEPGIEGPAVVNLTDVENVLFAECQVRAAVPGGQAGIRLGEVFGGRIEHCRIENVSIGVFVDTDSTDLTVCGNRIAAGGGRIDVGAIGIFFEDTFGPAPSYIEGNEISGFLIGIAVSRDPFGTPVPRNTPVTIERNRVIRSAPPDAEGPARFFGIDVASQRCTVRDNVVGYAFAVYGGIRLIGDESTVAANRLQSFLADPDATALPLAILIGRLDDDDEQPVDRDVVRGNRISGRQDGIVVSAGSAVVIEDNLLGEADAPPPRIGVGLANCDRSTVRGNRIVGADLAVLLLGGAGNRVVGNLVQGGGLGVGGGNETDLEVGHNRLDGLRQSGILIIQVAGSLAISHNRVVRCDAIGFPAQQGLGAIGIGILLATGEVVIESCETLDTGISDDGANVRQPATGIAAIFVQDCRMQDNTVGYNLGLIGTRDRAAEDRALRLWGLFEVQLTDLVALGGTALVTGNRLTGTGASALVEFHEGNLSDNVRLRFQRVNFSHNDCWHWSGPSQDDLATVVLRGESAIVMGNQIRSLSRFFPVNFNFIRGTFVGNHVDRDPVQTLAPPLFPNPGDTAFNLVG